MGTSISDRVRRLLFLTAGTAVAMLPAVAAGPAPHDTPPRLLAACNDIVDTTDSFSMNCVPTVIPDTSDQLTEAEVAEPGYNASPGGHGGGGHR